MRRIVDSRMAGGVILLALSSTHLAACAPALPPTRSTGLVFSDEGVHLAVVGQACAPTQQPNRHDDVDATLAIEVGNPVGTPVVVHKDRLLLKPADGSTVRPSPHEGLDIISIGSGETVTFMQTFLIRRSSCSEEMRLEPGSALELRGRSLDIAAARFAPAGSK